MSRSFPIRLLVALSGVKVAVGLFAYIASRGFPLPPSEQSTLPIEINILTLLVFGLSAGLLAIGGRRDLRAVFLAGFFVSMGSIYADRPILRLIESSGARFEFLLEAAYWFPLGAFMPFCLLYFVRLFPDTSTYPQLNLWLERGANFFAALGGIFVICSGLLWLEELSPRFSAPEICNYLSPHVSDGYFYVVLVFLLALAFVVAAFKSRVAEIRERRRANLLLAGLVIGGSPIIVASLLQILVPSFDAWVQDARANQLVGWAVFPPLFSIPFSTAYAVLVHKVLEVRFIARKALQYSLARYSALALAVVPLVCLVAYLYSHRSRTLQDIFSGLTALLLTTLAGLGVLLFVKRQKLLDAVDRRFFREQYDARLILTPLVDRIRNTAGKRELADLVANGIDRALHLETIALLVEEPDRGELVDPNGRIRPLMTSCPLVSLVASTRQPLEIDLEKRPEALSSLRKEDRDWLLDGDFRLLEPIVSMDGSLFGIIALGEKKSSLPFLKEDHQLTSAIANSAALALEVQRLRKNGTGEVLLPGTGPPTSNPAQECFGCGRLYLPHNRRCPTCEQELESALVPYVMPGRFRFEARIGAGGMGVVYRAVDLALSRPVAVKTMRRVSVDDALRLRREARAAAAVHHPNLALIYGVESWQGNPMLILEFLEHGTLEDRLREKVLGVGEALELGIAVAGALDKLHEANILHRDLKPSNIGYALDGSPKLMDFGIARVQFDVRRETAVATDGPTAVPGVDSMRWANLATPTTASKQLVGTLHYLSPEAVQGADPDVSFDLWGLTVVLYECLTGDRMFRGTIREVMEAIAEVRVPDIRDFRLDCPAALAEFFLGALHKDASRRPSSAEGFRRRLQALRSEVS